MATMTKAAASQAMSRMPVLLRTTPPRAAPAAIPVLAAALTHAPAGAGDVARIRTATIRQDATQMAELVVEAATQRLGDGRTAARDIVVKPTLIIRGSTGPVTPVP